MNKKILNVVAVLALMAGSACADVIGVDVQGEVYAGAGVLDTSSRTWTSVTSTTTDAFTLDGQDVDITFGSHNTGGPAGSPDISLFNTYKYTNSTSGFGFVITDLDPTKTYNLVCYGLQNLYGDPGRGATFEMVEGTTLSAGTQTTDGDNHTTFSLGENYVRWDNITPDTSLGDNRIRIIVKAPGGDAGEGIAIFNGFELESVPEPATMSLLALGGVAMLRRRKK